MIDKDKQKNIKENFLRNAESDFNVAKAKIEKCFQENREMFKDKIKLYEAISSCSNNEYDKFRLTYVRIKPEGMLLYSDYIDCVIRTQDMLRELILLPDTLIATL